MTAVCDYCGEKLQRKTFCKTSHRVMFAQKGKKVEANLPDQAGEIKDDVESTEESEGEEVILMRCKIHGFNTSICNKTCRPVKV